jgi:hypothetical protein
VRLTITVGVEQEFQERAAKASRSAFGSGALKSLAMRTRPFQPPGLRGARVWQTGTSFARGLPALAMMISSALEDLLRGQGDAQGHPKLAQFGRR